jgi:hypothetical protein
MVEDLHGLKFRDYLDSIYHLAQGYLVLMDLGIVYQVTLLGLILEIMMVTVIVVVHGDSEVMDLEDDFQELVCTIFSTNHFSEGVRVFMTREMEGCLDLFRARLIQVYLDQK